MEEKSDAAVIAQFFGRLPGQGLRDVLAEIKQLGDVEKKEVADGIRNGSFTY